MNLGQAKKMVPNGDWEATVEEFWPGHVFNFEELGFRVGPFFGIGYTHMFSSMIQDGGFARFKVGPTLKSSSSKLDTCQGHNSLTLAY